MERREIGDMGELIAARWLLAHDRKVLYRNYRGVNRGEVDIVARHRDVLTFVEVKSRTSTAFGRPADAVGPDKQRLIQRGAMDWLRLLGNPRIKFRFDIAEVVLIEGELPHVNVIENAFQMPDSSMAGR
ncbi:YraN family protein [Prosthecobacter sp.]|uniref:YraN family protein n=1 Tax=Prosthecobacter sp. TaxID=1965333 RepID=UPI001D95B9B3|nr:YraN family protein [Prosthecobacter sp.]MCB1277322.1 YraN family protein [Prosthecobacter sp.]